MILSLVALGAVVFAASVQADDQTATEAECVTFVDCPHNMRISHCSPVSYQFKAVKPRGEQPNRGTRYHLASGPGAIEERTGMWTFDPATVGRQDWDKPFQVIVSASMGNGQSGRGDTCSFYLRVYNSPPHANYAGPYHKDSIMVPAGQYNIVPIQWTDRDSCDFIRRYLMAVEPAPSGLYWLTDEGDFEFYPKAPDTGKTFHIRLMAHDGIDSTYYELNVIVTAPAGWSERYVLAIAKHHNVLFGDSVDVDVELRAANTNSQIGGLQGFDLLMGYDNTALALQSVSTASSPFFQQCKWEYFTYRFGAQGGCTTNCPSGMVRVVGIAETNNGPYHPTCPPLNLPSLPATLFTMRYLVSGDRTLECQFIPIRFFWVDCGDNTLSNWDGQQLHIAGRVFDYGNWDMPLDSSLATFPGYGGVPSDICHSTPPWNQEPSRSIDFHNGGVDIVCNEIDATGDLNLNGLPYEISDCVMFRNYFKYGMSAFQTHVQGSIAASDVNKDGLPLTLADFVYMQHIIVGDAYPVPPSPSADTVLLLLRDQSPTLILASPDTLGAIRLVFEGEVRPEFLLQDANLYYASDSGRTMMFIFGSCDNGAAHIVSGPILNGTAGHQLLQAEAATYSGAIIPVVIDYVTSTADHDVGSLPRTFALHQNYPNPFNAGTVISFDLPKAADVRLEVVNVAGQVVHEINRHYAAGSHQIEWDGTVGGRSVASGVYYYRLSAGEFTATKKMVLLK